MCEGTGRTGSQKLSRNRRQSPQQPLPRSFPSNVDGRGRGIGQGRPRARDSIVESQDPDPTARKHVMQRRIVHRKWRRGRGVYLDRAIPALNAGEMTKKRLGRRQPSHRTFTEAERPMQKAPRPARVDDEARFDPARLAWPMCFENSAITGRLRGGQLHLVEIFDACLHRLLHEEVIDVGAIPVRVADIGLRTGGDEKLPSMNAVISKWLVGGVREKAEAALEPARDCRMPPLPRAPLRKRPDLFQIVQIAQLI